MFPLIRRDRCDSRKPFIPCVGRYRAEVSGEFYWDAQRGGWCWTEIPTRRASSWRAKFYCGDHTGELYLLEACPFCGVPLPDIQAIADSTCDTGESD